MTLFLDHTIVPAHDKEESARFIARIFGLEYTGPWRAFAPVRINETLSLDFDERGAMHPHHYAFLATDEEFDVILQRIKDENVAFGSGPGSQDDGKINHLYDGRGFYFRDTNGHSWEVITHTYV